MRGRRLAARVVLLDRERNIFMINSVDPADPAKRPFWEIPGGGMDPGETSEQTAAREIVEETGITDFEMGPCIWTQQVQFTFAGMFFDSDERIHVAWCDGGEFAPRHLEYFEALAFRGARWWAPDDLLASEEVLLPPRMREFLTPIVNDEIPDAPIDIS